MLVQPFFLVLALPWLALSCLRLIAFPIIRINTYALILNLFTDFFSNSLIFLLVKIPCRAGSNTIEDGGNFNPDGYGCDICVCHNGTLSCPPIMCLDVPCHDGVLQIKSGDCCPRCVKQTKCKHAESNKIFITGESYFTDRDVGSCKVCTCSVSGDFSCRKKTCPSPYCPNPVKVDGSCCLVCPAEIRCKQPETG